MTTSPRPLPPIRPAITTIESAKRIVWLTPRRSIRRARGSCTLQSTCRARRAHRLGRLDGVRRHAADPERRDADRRRDRVDHRRDHRRAGADREEDHDRHQVRESGDDLHRVENGRDRALEAVGRPARTPSGIPTSEREADRGEHQRERLHALEPEPTERERREGRERPERGPHAAEPERDERRRRRSCRSRSSSRRSGSSQATRSSRNVAKPLKARKTTLGFSAFRWSRATSGSRRGGSAARSTRACPATGTRASSAK